MIHASQRIAHEPRPRHAPAAGRLSFHSSRSMLLFTRRKDKMKRFLVELGAHLAALVILLVTIGTTALIFGGAVGGTAIGVAPEYHFKLLADLGLICPKGDTVTFHDGGQITTTDSSGNT